MKIVVMNPGRMLMTPGAMEMIAESGQKPSEFLIRHCYCDWGDLDAHDTQANKNALITGDRILSSYKTTNGEDVWIITDAIDINEPGANPLSRQLTTILLPSEY